jgi:excisionase family DNA binding protein
LSDVAASDVEHIDQARQMLDYSREEDWTMQTTAASQSLTVAEACRVLRVTPPTMRRWIAEGAIQARRLGRHYRIDASEVQRLLKPAAEGERA